MSQGDSVILSANEYAAADVRDLPWVTVIVLTYNHFEHIYKTLNSILLQDYPKLELIISDDCSRSFPEGELNGWIEKNCVPRELEVRVIRNPENLGIVRHANTAAKMARGEYVKFLPAGDRFVASGSLSDLVDFALENGQDIVTSPALVCNETSVAICYEFPSKRRVNVLQNTVPAKLFSVIAASNIISAVGTMFSADFFSRGGFDEAYRNLEDWPTWLRILRNGEEIPCISTPTVYYMTGGISSEGGTAFDSPVLRNDLKLCIEKEILPHKKQLTLLSHWVVQYRYECLKSENAKMKLRFRFLPLQFYFFVKRCVKRLIINK